MENTGRAVVSYVFDRLWLAPPDPCILPLPLEDWPGYSIDRSSSGNLRVWRQLERDAGGGLTVYEYGMPWTAHMAWCDWCSDVVDNDPS